MPAGSGYRSLQDVLPLLVALSGQVEEREFRKLNLLLLEIWDLVFAGVPPSDVANAEGPGCSGASAGGGAPLGGRSRGAMWVAPSRLGARAGLGSHSVRCWAVPDGCGADPVVAGRERARDRRQDRLSRFTGSRPVSKLAALAQAVRAALCPWFGWARVAGSNSAHAMGGSVLCPVRAAHRRRAV